MRQGARLRTLLLREKCVRCLSGCGTGSVLGTSTMSGSLLKRLQEDLENENELRTKGMGETLQNCVHRAELSHMESPEADARFLKTLDAKVDDLFTRIPLPQDPMKAALALTDEEVKENAAAELLKEAVREMYLRKLDFKQAEELRLKKAEERLRMQGASQCFKERHESERLCKHETALLVPKPVAVEARPPGCNEDGETLHNNLDALLEDEELREELRGELAAMKAKVARLEELLCDKK
ncbi:hypothetical protein JKF63_03735 [Porcisia hertigi]|uniref:Uncharacterized protein n=1 Tax=Porcisia hertigi TaxID=2761500 RepID=A0A836HWV9_9TRYP|nr:hypothetical protein JKF63_03735 [Porcisia hertigi]